MLLKELKDKKIVILGFAREGKDSFLFLRKLFPNKVIAIADENEKVKTKLVKVRWHLGKDYLKDLNQYDLIIKSPGIPFKILPKSILGKVVEQTNLFFDNYQGTIIGITGTKGKSTTASMIYQVLKAGKVKVKLAGNIGQPVLSFIKKKDVFVYELSSHQLYNLKKSPHIAVFLNIYPEHLDYYKDFEDYLKAKTNIFRHQKKEDYLIYNSEDKIVKEKVKDSLAKKIKIKGEHYQLSRMVTREVGKLFEIPKDVIEKALNSFKYLPHRLELVGTFKGITFYNDSLATIPEATIAAIKTFDEQVETIILGGHDRKINFDNLAKVILKSKIKNIILFPVTGRKIYSSIMRQKNKKGINYFFVEESSGAKIMAEAIKIAYRETSKNKICLLSNASASFNLFKDYRERGDLFKKEVIKQGKGYEKNKK